MEARSVHQMKERLGLKELGLDMVDYKLVTTNRYIHVHIFWVWNGLIGFPSFSMVKNLCFKIQVFCVTSNFLEWIILES